MNTIGMILCGLMLLACIVLAYRIVSERKRYDEIAKMSSKLDVRFISHRVQPPKHRCHFKLWGRNQCNGRTSYKCKCGNFYANGWPTGWRQTNANRH